MMDIAWSEKDKAFQQEVRQFFAEALTDDIRRAAKGMTSVYADHEASMHWQEKLVAKGWAAPHWPVEYGGCDWSIAQHYIFARERAIAGAPPLSPMGIQMCAPAIIAFGSEEQKNFFLPRMLSGEHFWCQGYSEPGAGSDLASLKMSAVSDGDHYICNGSKIWTTHADEANWCFCLVRTAKEDRPQKGITFLLIDMSTPGIVVKPIVSLTGEHIQNQIFFDDVRVPKANVIGEEGKGWTVAKYLLEFERGGAAYAPLMHERLNDIRELAKTIPGDNSPRLIEDPIFAAKLASVEIETATLEMYERQAMSAISAGGSPGMSASVMKILGTELQQHVTELAIDAAAYAGLPFQPQAGAPGGKVLYPYNPDEFVGPTEAALAPLRYFNERAGSIYAGSNEIQRNILAKAALGL
ncbi:acyl-CoA dehydrogenase family protein [Spongiibacter taiwanensis]|uniref:acyl-CoA dehydrogenase family protein n=1 Tax=Spongiibacter taiwanensis TaxID=1748242 RepID=UPI0020357272|nr:acyl-CoA dehydrogenase family protein [Spongiibacter taiwanensis]USA44044.1 acyl-CoA dehydrogenase family protein [Spongiibacter taiwanensis]